MASASLGMIKLNPLYFLGAGFIGLILSSIHLGKKMRAWRSVLNIKNSWLSREILGYGLFLGSALVWFIIPEYRFIAYTSVLFGFGTSYIIDKVYIHTEKTTAMDIHSSSVFLTALLMTSLLTSNERFTLLILGLKFLLYSYRKVYFLMHKRNINYVIPVLRMVAGFILPIVMWLIIEAFNPYWVISLIATGELMDRIEFYLKGEIITPKRELLRATNL